MNETSTSFDPTTERFLGTVELGELLGLDAKTVERLARRGELPGVRYGRTWKFLLTDVLRWHRQHSSDGSRRKEDSDAKTRANSTSVAPGRRRMARPVLVHEPDRRPNSLPPSDFFNGDKARSGDEGGVTEATS